MVLLLYVLQYAVGGAVLQVIAAGKTKKGLVVSVWRLSAGCVVAGAGVQKNGATQCWNALPTQIALGPAVGAFTLATQVLVAELK